jgi:hypothetical protein
MTDRCMFYIFFNRKGNYTVKRTITLQSDLEVLKTNRDRFTVFLKISKKKQCYNNFQTTKISHPPESGGTCFPKLNNAMKKLSLLILMVVNLTTITACNTSETASVITTQTIQTTQTTATTYTRLSTYFINALRNNENVQPIIDSLANVAVDVLSSELTDDNRKKAFWMNVYNGFIQVLLTENPDLYKDRNDFFHTKRITVAGQLLSFDDIEHGIIRRSKIKLSLGLLSKWNVSDFEKQFRTEKTDGRVHFALNCGAKSCPAVAAYKAEGLDEQMDKSTKKHLNATSQYDEAKNMVYVTSLLSWFRGDFGNKNKVRNLLKKYEVLPENANKTSISYQTYDWTLYLDNFIDL